MAHATGDAVAANARGDLAHATGDVLAASARVDVEHATGGVLTANARKDVAHAPGEVLAANARMLDDDGDAAAARHAHGRLHADERDKRRVLIDDSFIQKPFDTGLILHWNRAPRSTSERPRMIPIDSSLDCFCFWLFRTVSAGS